MKFHQSKILLSLLFILQHLCIELEANPKKDTRIVGGAPTSIAKERYIVNLRRNGVFICGGALVSRRFVVTAAHCVYGANPKDIAVVGGSSFLTRGGNFRSVSKIMMPGRFHPKTMNMDVAVIKLRARMRGRHTAPIRLCSHRLQAGMSMRVSGWGLTKETNTKPSQRLRTTVVRLVSHRSCQRSYRGLKITRSMICGSLPGRKDSCSGDSGGPLVHNKQLCGVVSWGVGCGRRGSPGVYTSINQVKGFIARSMKH